MSSVTAAVTRRLPWQQEGWPKLRTALLALAVLSPLLRLATYQPLADGSRPQYVRAVFFGAAAAAVVWLLVRVQTHPRSLLPWLCAVVVLVSGDIVHYVRLAHPAMRQSEFVLARDDFALPGAGNRPDGSRWQVEVKPGASVNVADGRLQVQNAPNAIGYVELKAPPRPQPNDGKFWLPLGLYTDEFGETLEWDAQVRVQNQFYIVVETKRLLVQATTYGLHITYPAPTGEVTGHEVNLSGLRDGQLRPWQLERTPQITRLSLDGREVWSRPQVGHFEYIRFGETRSDDLHGGTLALDNVRYSRRYR